MAARVLIVDDDCAMRQVIRLFVEGDPDFEVVGEAGDCDEAIAMRRELNPEIVTMDYRMPSSDGAACIKSLKRDDPHLPILAVTSAGEKAMAEMLEAGAFGKLDKAHVGVVVSALREGLTQLSSKDGSPSQGPEGVSAMEQLRHAIERLEQEAADALARQKTVIGKRVDLLAALNAICVALDNPKYSERDALQRIRGLTEAALASDAADGVS